MPCVAVLYYQRPAPMRSTAPLRSSLLNATQRFVYLLRRLSSQRCASLRDASLLNSAIFLLSTHRFSSPRPSTPLNDLFFINAPNRYAALGPSTLLSDLFVINASLRDETQRYSTPRNAFQLNDLFIILASLLYSTMRGETQRYSTQRNQPIGELNVPKITTNYKNMRYVS